MTNVVKCMHEVFECQEAGFDDWHDVMPNTGLYVRYLNMPAGTMLIGKEHAEWSVNILTAGTLVVMSDIKGEQVRLTAPQVFETGPGTQKIGKALTDVTFMNVVRAAPGETKEDIYNRIVKHEEV